MSLRLSRFLALSILLLASWPSRAAFHLWAMDEIFSSADGAIQYVELRALSGGQQFLKSNNTTLVSGTGPGAKTFNFPNDLPGDTANKRMLVGTASFAALNLVMPDYVVPDNFFEHPSGALNFANSADAWTYTGVPTSGPVALFRTGTTGDRNPTNFAGDSVNPPRLANISTRSQVLTGADVMIAGFVIGGTTSKRVVVRARGPSMAAQGVPGVLANPQLQLFQGQSQIGFNDDYQSAPNSGDVIAFGFAPDSPLESAILATLAPGAYTAIVTGVNQGTGVAIVEVFEVGGIEIPLINIATRARVQTGDNVMIAGLIIQGSGPQQVVVRARGPSLSAQGVPDVLGNPVLQLYTGPTQLAVNDNWQDAANKAAIQASGFAPDDPFESAILTTLPPGAYTAIVTGSGGSTGVAIVEVFKVN